MTKPMMISTIEMTRRIRDDHAKRLEHASTAERIVFYRDKAQPFLAQDTADGTTSAQK